MQPATSMQSPISCPPFSIDNNFDLESANQRPPTTTQTSLLKKLKPIGMACAGIAAGLWVTGSIGAFVYLIIRNTKHPVDNNAGTF